MKTISRTRKIHELLDTLEDGPPLMEAVNVAWDDPERGYLAQYRMWVSEQVMDKIRELK